MRTFLHSILFLCLCVALCARDPEAIDRSNQFKQAIEAARAALTQEGDLDTQRVKLQAALSALQTFSKQYPGFQADSLDVRMEAIRLRLKILATANVAKENDHAQLPTTLALYNQMELLLLENIRLRDELASEKEKQAGAIPDVNSDFQDALKTVAELQRKLEEQEQASRKSLKAQAKELTFLRSELKKLSTINLDLTGESERRAKTIDQLRAALKKASEKTFTKEEEYEALKKDAARLQNEVTALKDEVEQAHTIIKGLKVGNTEPLKKKYEDTRMALLKQAELIGKERDVAKASKKAMVETQKALDVLQIQNSKLREALKLYRQGSDNVIIQELENTVAVYKEKLAAATETAEAANMQLNEWKAINQELLKSLNTASPKTEGPPGADLRKQIDVQHTLIEQLRVALKEYEAQNAQLKLELAKKPATMPVSTDQNPTSPAALTEEQKQEIQLLVQQGKAAIVVGNLVQAESFLQKAMELDPTGDEARGYLAEVCLKKGDVAGAQSYLATLDLTPAVLRLHTSIHKKAKNTDSYLAQLLKAVASQPENNEIRMITAQNLRRIKYHKLAEYQLNELWKRNPDSFDYAREYYFLYVSMGLEYTNLQKKWYNKALEIDSTRRNELIIQE